MNTLIGYFDVCVHNSRHLKKMRSKIKFIISISNQLSILTQC